MAADIFTGAFTLKWRHAAAAASRVMGGTLYGNYYDLPPESAWTARPRTALQHGKEVAADFAELCNQRAAEAGTGGSRAARNGAVLEQSQILTTHNLAVLIDGLDLDDQLREQAPELARQALRWTVRRLTQPASGHAALIQVKNAAYAWRQALFLLSYCDPAQQLAQARQLADESAGTRLGPAADGLAHIIAGDRFAADGTIPGGAGRRFLGWARGPHWYFRQPPPSQARPDHQEPGS
jgi:hypothetical protein